MVGDYTSKMLKLLVFIFDGTLEPVFAVQIQNDTTLIKAMVALREIRLYHKRKKWFIRTHLQQRRVIVAEMVIGSLPEIRMWFGHNLNSLLRDRAAFRLPCPFQVVYIKFHFHSSKSIGLVVFTAPPHAFLRWNHARTHGIDCHGFDMSYRGRLPLLWMMLLLMICSGASEATMAQWASAFTESALGVSKTVGDLAGPCLFAAFMGISRILYGKMSEKLNLTKTMLLSGLLCVACYLLAALSPLPVFGLAGCALCGFSVGIMWPGAFSMAAKFLRGGGTALFALLALAGDLGCSAGPSLVGFVSGALGDELRLGILAGTVFPLLLLVGLFACQRMMAKKV